MRSVQTPTLLTEPSQNHSVGDGPEGVFTKRALGRTMQSQLPQHTVGKRRCPGVSWLGGISKCLVRLFSFFLLPSTPYSLSFPPPSPPLFLPLPLVFEAGSLCPALAGFSFHAYLLKPSCWQVLSESLSLQLLLQTGSHSPEDPE